MPRARPSSTKPRQRRSFSQKNLAGHQQGPLGPLLAEALTVPEASGYRLTHAFHPYPGRFHPDLPRTLLQTVARSGQRVLDPFMGGGTTLVEALGLGLAATGNDLNPVALLVARERTRPRTPAQALRVVEEAKRIAAQVEALRGEKQPPHVSRRHQHRIAPHYQPHLLAELMQWIRLIEAVREQNVRETLLAVFSSGVVKFSNQTSDSDPTPQPARYPKGAVTRFLVRKTDELIRAQAELGHRIPQDTPPVRLYQEDARLLPSLGWGQFDHILTSPPYPGTYDYHTQHQLRLDWLNLEGERLAAAELGARREPTPESWSDGLRDVLVALARVIRPDGNLFLVMGDWITGDHGVDAAGLLQRLATTKGWRMAAQASVQRQSFSRIEAKAFAKRGKWEHLLHFTRTATPREP